MYFFLNICWIQKLKLNLLSCHLMHLHYGHRPSRSNWLKYSRHFVLFKKRIRTTEIPVQYLKKKKRVQKYYGDSSWSFLRKFLFLSHEQTFHEWLNWPDRMLTLNWNERRKGNYWIAFLRNSAQSLKSFVTEQMIITS